MKRLLVICHMDPEYFDNNRIHHLIAYARDRYEVVTVIYLEHVSHTRTIDKLASFCRLDMRSKVVDGVKYIAVHPLFASGKAHRTTVSAPGEAPERQGVAEAFAQVRRELVGVAGHALESTYGHSFLRAYRKFDGSTYDVVVAQGVWALDCALMLRKEGKARMVFCDDFDFSPGNYLNSAVRRSLVRAFENERLKQCDGVITVGNMLRDLRERETGRKVHVVPNGMDGSKLKLARTKVPHPPTMIYIGSVEKWSGIDIVMQAMAVGLPELQNVRFVIVGHGQQHYIDEILALAKKLGIQDRVEYAGKQPFDQLAKFLAAADVGIATFRPFELRKYAASLKVVEYLAGGVCPLVTEGLQAAECIAKYECGLTTACAPTAIANALARLFRDPEYRKACVERGAGYVEDLEWDKLLAEYQRIMEEKWLEITAARPS